MLPLVLHLCWAILEHTSMSPSTNLLHRSIFTMMKTTMVDKMALKSRKQVVDANNIPFPH